MRVLLVEDDPMIGKSVQQGLRQDGHTVDWVRESRAAELALATTQLRDAAARPRPARPIRSRTCSPSSGGQPIAFRYS
jgi:CheY-like chemotaxis protein